MKSVALLVAVVVGLVGLFAVATQATDYCSPTLCNRGAKHIACGNSGRFASTCSPDRREVYMSPQIINAIVNRHNEKRNILASGRLGNYRSAPRMATMIWDNELAYLAGLNAKTCKYEHDQCHNTDRFKYSGQNIAIKWSSVPFTNPDILEYIIPMVDSWWAENKDANMRMINNYPSSPRKMIGHFTVMGVEENNALGCAMTMYRDRKMRNDHTMLMVCNYGRTNMIGNRIYEEGRPTSKCNTGAHPLFRFLCSLSERYQ